MTRQTDNDPKRGKAADLGRIDQAMEGLATPTGAVLHRYPQPGQPVRQVVLRDHRDAGATQLEVAVLEADGTLRIIGHDQGPGVSAALGSGITSYEWVYVVVPDRVASLVEALSGHEDDDVLALLATYYEQHGGRLDPLLKRPEVGAEFSNWHS